MARAALCVDLLTERKLIDQELSDLIQTQSACGPVTDCMMYSVLGGGQRVRPVLSLRVGRMLAADRSMVLRGALAVELFHCASLIVDDLPCMDDDDVRRNRPAAHVMYGQSTAILAAFGLVALAARTVTENAAVHDLAELADFQNHLLRALDCNGLIAGQALDLAVSGRSDLAVADLKTATLFQLAARAGLVTANAVPEERRAVLRFGREFGLAFQLGDDVLDADTRTREPFEAQMEAARSCLRPFGDSASELHELLDYIHARTL